MTKKMRRRKFIIAGLAVLGVAIVGLLEYPKRTLTIQTPTTTLTPPKVSQEALNAFYNVLGRTKIMIYTPSGEVLRDLRDKPYSNDLEYGWEGINHWDSSFIRCDEAGTSQAVNLKADILWGLYYSPHNSDNTANHWGDVPVTVCDTFYWGDYTKIVRIDGVAVHTYESGVKGTNSKWIHFNMQTLEVKAF